MSGADVFVGVSGPNLVMLTDLKRMNRGPIVLAMANPNPEVWPEEAAAYVRIMGTGRSDYPNQVNNCLCFPGLFRGVLDVRARTVNDEMKLAAARAIADVLPENQLNEEYIIPGVFDASVAAAVAKAVANAAYDTGVARRRPKARHRQAA